MKKAITIIQVRMGSTRLPGKPLLKIGNESVLERMIKRLRKSKATGELVVATSMLRKDDDIERMCQKLKTRCFRGSGDDVLSRFVSIARKSDADYVLRICGDQPFIDPKIVDSVLERHDMSGADYTSTAIIRTFPKGVDVEVINKASLFMAGKNATPYEKEHVTPRFFSDSSFKTYNFSAPEELRFPKLNLCLDTAQDLNYLRKIYSSVTKSNNDNFRTKDIIRLVRQRPEIKRKPLLVFRADGGWKRGMGHIYPSLDICCELKRRTDVDITFISRDYPECTKIIEQNGLKVIRLKKSLSEKNENNKVLEILSELRPDVYITDLLHISENYADELRKLRIRTVSIDVLGTTRFRPDAMINRTTVRKRIKKYNLKSKITKYYLGPRYVVLSKHYLDKQKKKDFHSLKRRELRILLSFGGSDPKNLSLKALKAIKSLGIKNKTMVAIGAAYKHTALLERFLAKVNIKAVVKKDVKNMAVLMGWADIAITSTGKTIFELARTGTPAITMSVEPEQIVNENEFKDEKIRIDLGWAHLVSIQKLRDKIAWLASDIGRLEGMSAKGKKLVDGKGLERVCDIILELMDYR